MHGAVFSWLLLSAAQEILPEMRLDANAHHLMATDALLLPILLAFVPRLLNTQFTRSPLERLTFSL